jgi:hypothetical protein
MRRKRLKGSQNDEFNRLLIKVSGAIDGRLLLSLQFILYRICRCAGSHEPLLGTYRALSFWRRVLPIHSPPEMVDFHNLSNTNLNSRFEQMINTFWLASLAPEASTETSRRISVYCCPERRGIRCIETTSLSQLTERTQQSLIWKKSTTAIAGGSAHSSFPACSFS